MNAVLGGMWGEDESRRMLIRYDAWARVLSDWPSYLINEELLFFSMLTRQLPLSVF